MCEMYMGAVGKKNKTNWKCHIGRKKIDNCGRVLVAEQKSMVSSWHPTKLTPSPPAVPRGHVTPLVQGM